MGEQAFPASLLEPVHCDWIDLGRKNKDGSISKLKRYWFCDMCHARAIQKAQPLCPLDPTRRALAEAEQEGRKDV